MSLRVAIATFQNGVRPLIFDMFQVLIDICNEPFVRHRDCRVRNATRHSLTLEFEWYHLIPLKLLDWCHWSILLSRYRIQIFFFSRYAVYMVWESREMSDFHRTLRVPQEFLYHNLGGLNCLLIFCDTPRSCCKSGTDCERLLRASFIVERIELRLKFGSPFL